MAHWIKSKVFWAWVIFLLIWFWPLISVLGTYAYARRIIKLGECEAIGSRFTECIINGHDYTELVNQAGYAGFAIGIVVVPWLITGAVIFVLILLVFIAYNIIKPL